MLKVINETKWRKERRKEKSQHGRVLEGLEAGKV